MDRKALGLWKPSTRFFRPWSVIFSHLLASQHCHFTKDRCPPKLRWMDCKALSLLRPSPRYFRPSSESLFRLFNASQQIHLTKLLTTESWDWWIVKKWGVWDLHQSFSGFYLWLCRTCPQSQQTHLTKVSYQEKFRLIDLKPLSLLRLSPRLLKPSSLIFSHLEKVNNLIIQKHLLLKIEVERY